MSSQPTASVTTSATPSHCDSHRRWVGLTVRRMFCSVPEHLQVLRAVVRQTGDGGGGMRLLVVLLSAGLTWCGLIIGVAVGVAFGTLASLSTFFLALHQPELRRSLIESAEHSAARVLGQPGRAATAA